MKNAVFYFDLSWIPLLHALKQNYIGWKMYTLYFEMN